MAGKTYVCVAPIKVTAVFDSKYKSPLAKRMTAAFEKAIKSSSKLTTKPPADKKAEGFYLTGSLSLKKTDKGIEAKLSMVLATWPKKSMFAMPNFEASTEVANPDKKDVDAVIDALLGDAQAQVIELLEKRAK
jgi:hypothetical protein